jgi:hypothetical protein
MPSLSAGAWTGSIVESRNDQVIVKSTEENWLRARTYILGMQDTIVANQVFHFKTLEQHQGFLVYIARAFPSLVPYLKGIHLTLDSWREGRDREGWKSFGQVMLHLEGAIEGQVYPTDPPEFVTAVPRLASDVEGLLTLFNSPVPPIWVVRARTLVSVYYGFGNASGVGFW